MAPVLEALEYGNNHFRSIIRHEGEEDCRGCQLRTRKRCSYSIQTFTYRPSADEDTTYNSLFRYRYCVSLERTAFIFFFRVDATGLNRPGKFLISLRSSLPPETLFCLVLMMTSTMMMIISIKKVLKFLLLFLF